MNRHSAQAEGLPPTATLRQNPARYWPDDGPKSALFRVRYPDPARLLEMAESATHRSIQFWHPWHLEPTHFPETISRRIDWEQRPNGDPEWAHALARFTHMVDLGAAYALTGRAIFLVTYDHHLGQYLRSRDESRSFWQNKLNSAIRLTNLVRSYDLLRAAGQLSDATVRAAYQAMVIEGEFLLKRLGQHVGNWEFSITTALATVSLYLANICDVKGWETAALRRLNDLVESEILDDGTFSEQVPMYQGTVVLSLLDYFVALRSNGRRIPSSLAKATSTLLASLVDLTDPTGKIPPIGDSDALPVHYLLDNARETLDDLRCARPTHATGFSLREYRTVGWTVVRWDMAEEGAGYLLFDASGRPPTRRNWHSHADDLQFILHTSSGPMLTDPGRFTYTPDFRGYFTWLQRPFPRSAHGRFRFVHHLLFPQLRKLNRKNWRAYFQRTLSHNTASFEGRDCEGYDQKSGEDQIIERTPPRSDNSTIRIEALARARASARVHRRRLFGLLPRIWLVLDDLESPREGRWCLSHHFGSGLSCSSRVDGISAKSSDRGTQAFLAWACDVGRPEVRLVDDWVSPRYNHMDEARTAHVWTPLSRRCTVLSVIVLSNPGHEPVHVAARFDSGLFVVEGDVSDERWRIVVNPPGGSFRWDDVELEGEVCVLEGSSSRA